MFRFKKMTCDACGKNFTNGNTNGLPNGVAMVGKDGKKTTLCQACIMELGALEGSQRDAWWEKHLGAK